MEPHKIERHKHLPPQLRALYRALFGVVFIAMTMALGHASRATAGPGVPASPQLFSVQANQLSGSADRLDVAFGNPGQPFKVGGVFALSSEGLIKGTNCAASGFFSDHQKNVNPPPLTNLEVWTLVFPSKCLRSFQEVLISATPVDSTNHLVIEGAVLYNTNGTTDLTDDTLVGSGNTQKLNFAKFPRLENLFLCNQPSDFSLCNGAVLFQVLGQPINSPDPKCTGFPNFQDPATCPRQELGSFEYEIRFDPKLVDVRLVPLVDQAFDSSIGTCLQNAGQGFVRLACVTKGKNSPILAPTILSAAVITPKPAVSSMLIANQQNGIVTPLVNQGCKLSDLQGHPIPLEGLSVCQDGAVTIRYLEGDVNGDCVVDVRDQQQIAFRWGSHTGQLLYNNRFDLEPAAPKLGNGVIDAKDLQVVFGRHESTCTDPHPPQPPADPKAIP